MSDAFIPADWNDAEVLSGLQLADKAELIGVPFLVIGCQFEVNSTGVPLCYIDAQRTDGSKFTFQDSSTGAKTQLVKYLTAKGKDAGIETGEYIDFRLVVPEGLRVSVYDREVKGPGGRPTGKMQQAKTYYLSTNGERETAAKTAKAATSAARKSATNN